MWFFWFWLITMSWTGSGILGVPTDKFILNEATPQCEDKGEILSCDLNSIQENEVYMVRLKDSKFKKVFIYSATNLYLTDDICVDVTLHNVKNARVDKTDGGSCNEDFELTATKSEFSEIYLKANKLYLEECIVEKLVTESKLDKLTILKSQIQELNVVGGLADNTTALIKDSQVKTIAKLTVESELRVLLQTSRVDIIKAQGIFIDQGIVTYDLYPLLFWVFFSLFIVSTMIFITIHFYTKDICKTSKPEEEKLLKPKGYKHLNNDQETQTIRIQSLASHLKKLQDIFSQFESVLTGGNDNEQTNIISYSKGQRQKDEKSFLESLRILINSVNSKFNNLEDLRKRYTKVFEINEETKDLTGSTDYPCFHDKSKDTKQINLLNESVKDQLQSAKESIEKQEVDLNNLIRKMNELKNPKNAKEKECCEHITLFNDIIDNVSDLQVTRLQHNQFLLSIIIQSTKNVLFSWLHFQIYYAKFHIAELEKKLCS